MTLQPDGRPGWVLDSAGGRRLHPGTFTGGRQLNAGPLGGTIFNHTGGLLIYTP